MEDNVMQDKVEKYFKHYLDRYVFIELSPDYIARAGNISFLTGVKLPIKKEDEATFGKEVLYKFNDFAEAMVFVMGADIHSRYAEQYIRFMTLHNPKIRNTVVKQGLDFAEQEQLELAAIHLRAALQIDPEWLDANYNYARVCRHLYQKSEDPVFITDFKAESTKYFEITAEKHPKFAQSFYFLGFHYFNANLYIKAQITWEKYLRISKNGTDKKEIRLRLSQLEKWVVFEQGYTAIDRGKYKEGISILEGLYAKYPDMANVYFFLAKGYMETGRLAEAITMFKKVLEVIPSQVLSMALLADCYDALGDKQNAEKYRNKAALINKERSQKK
jgi:tetratricopeptide (TPR) repeat protein